MTGFIKHWWPHRFIKTGFIKTISWPHSLLLIVKRCGHASVLWTQSSSNSETMRSWKCFYEPSHLLIVKRCSHENVFMNPVIFYNWSDAVMRMFLWTQSSSNSETMQSWKCFYEPSHLLIVKRCVMRMCLWTQSSSNSEAMRSWECFFEPSHLLMVKRCGHEIVLWTQSSSNCELGS
jgi:hypothetical protein